MSNSLIILAIDATTEHAGIAIRRAQALVAETNIHSTDGFGHLLFPAIEETLAKAKLRLSDIDCFVAANGPGSFTGVRMGLTAVKGLAAALDKPALGVSNLRALSTFGHSSQRAVVLDARRGAIYAAVYDDQTNIVQPETVCEPAPWFAALPPGVELIGFPFNQAPRHLAPALAYCAERDGPAAWQDPAALDANYVRRSDAESSWKEIA